MCWLSEVILVRIELIASEIAMRLREVDSTYGAVVDIDPSCGGQRVARVAVHVDRVSQSALSDEIEQSESAEDDDDEEKLDEISDDSSNLGDEVPVATKLLTGRIRRRKVKSQRGDGDDVGKRRARKAAPRDWLLKYLQPNVSNVAARSGDVNAGNGSLIGGESSLSVRQSEVSCKDSSSSEEEKEHSPSVSLPSRGQPEGTSVAEDEGMGDADDEDFTDFEALAFTKRKDAIKDRAISEKAKLKDQAGNAQKTPVTAIVDCSHPSEGSIPTFPRDSFSVIKTKADDCEISSRKPLVQIHQRDLESAKCDVPKRMSPQTREKRHKENEAPRKRKLSLSKDSRRQLSLKSFLKPFSAVVADVQSL